MGWATIENNLKEGLYRVKIDSGEDRRVALVNAANQALTIVGKQITASYEQVVIANGLEEEARQTISDAIDQIVVLNDPGAVEIALRVFAELQKKYSLLIAANQPVRRQYQTLKISQSNLLRQLNTWTSLQTITYQEAWCVDYSTAGGTGGIVATVDIPGDSSLVLIAPGLRTFRYGDGTISSARKAAALSKRSIDLINAGKQLAEITTALNKAKAEEAVLKIEVDTARSAYATSPTKTNELALRSKTIELADKRNDISNLTLNKQLVETTIKRLELEITTWSSKSAKDIPDPGDGYMWERSLLSPAQTFFNAAIFPGWQKWMPTYRWGVASNINETSNTMDVTLNPAYSSAQGLNVNEKSLLTNVPVKYMTCNAAAFEDGDKVVVQFDYQQLDSPTVIGFVDHPRPCVSWPIVWMNLEFETSPSGSPGTKPWSNVVLWDSTPSCGEWYYRIGGISAGGPFNRPIAPPARHTLILSQPAFANPTTDETYFELQIEGGSFGVPLWEEGSSAWSFDTSAGSTGAIPLGDACTSFRSTFSTTQAGNVTVNKTECTSFTQTLPTVSGVTLWPECLPLNATGSGAWIHPGYNTAIESVPFTDAAIIDETANDFVDGRGAMPTISVKRKGSTKSKIYKLIEIQRTELTSLRHRWQMAFTKS